MLAATNIAFSSALYLGDAAVFEYETSIITWAIAALFSLMPDIDLPTSKVGRPLFFISVSLERRFGHSIITHSFIGVAVLYLLASPLYYTFPLFFWAIVGGYWSHLQIDMANIRGVDLFWPSAIRVVMPGKIKYRLEVGSKAEMIVLVSMIVLAVGLYHPVMFSGSRVRLHYAKASDLGKYLNMVVIRGEVVVQFWLRPGDEVVELNFSGGGDVGSMPDVLNNL